MLCVQFEQKILAQMSENIDINDAAVSTEHLLATWQLSQSTLF